MSLLTLGATAPDHVTLAINAANAVLVPSDAEGFGLAVLEALACDVPVLATPVGIHAEALAGIEGTLCAPYDRGLWAAALAPALADPEPRVAGRERAAEFATDVMAGRALPRGVRRSLRRAALQGSRIGAPMDGLREQRRATSFLQRARLRRRVRFLRRRRELALHELGGLRARETATSTPELAALAALDDELTKLAAGARERARSSRVLREPGIAACPQCPTIHDSAANFCPNCGAKRAPLSRAASTQAHEA